MPRNLYSRPQTSRSMSAGAADKSRRPPRKPLPAQSTSQAASTASPKSEEPQDNVTIIQVSNTSTVSQDQDQPPELPPKNTATAEVFRFPEVKSKVNGKQHLPQAHQEYKSNVQIIPSNVQSSSSTSTIQVGSSNSYTTPIKQSASNGSSSSTPANSSGTTKVKVVNEGEATTVAVYGTCYPSPSSSSAASNPIKSQTPKLSKKIILSANTSGITNISINSEQGSDAIISGNVHYEKVFLSSSIPISSSASPTRSAQPVSNGSPVLSRRRLASPQTQVQPVPQNAPRRTPQLTRGLTELVISSRPSRRDFHYLKLLNSPLKTKTAQKSSSATNNNIEHQPASSSQVTAVQRVTTSESQEQRRRSSSTSDAQAPLQRAPRESGSQRNANNNEFTPSRSSAFRMQPPPQGAPPGSSIPASTNPAQQSPNKRLTLREQQVMQLRREIMHPGGVRLNLRRKDCVGSIAWLDAFGGVW